VLGFFLWQTLFGSKENGYSQEKTEPSYSEHQATDENAIRSSAAPSRANSIDDAIVEYTKWFAIFTLFLVLATIGLFVSSEQTVRVASRSADAAKQAADVAKDTLTATNRPWIQIKAITIASSLIFEPTPDDHEGRVNLNFLIKNTGNSPAVRIQVFTKLTIGNISDLRSAQKIYCDDIRALQDRGSNSRLLQPEITLFPGDQISIASVAWMNPDQLAEFREWAGKIPGAIVTPVIIGCVLYEFTFAKGYHQTGIIYGIRKLTPYPPDQPLPSYSTVPPNFPIKNEEGAIHLEGTVAASDLAIQQEIVGTGPID
jgi:hypothetical protein